MKGNPKLPLPSLAEARHLAEFGDLRALEALDLRRGPVIAAEIAANYRPIRPVCPVPTTTPQPDTRSAAEVIAALKAAITPADQADSAERETARRLLLKARRLRKAKAATRRRAVAARAPKPKPAPAAPASGKASLRFQLRSLLRRGR